MRATRALAFALVAGVAAGCASPRQEERSDRSEWNTLHDTGSLVGEAKDARTRAKAHTELAAAYYELGNVGIALEEVRIALAADSGYAQAYNIQGLVNMDLKDTPAAESSFQRGLRIAPQDPDLNHNYGWFLCQTDRADQSVQWFLNAVRNPLYATPAKSYTAAARCLANRNPQQAGEYFDRALRLDPNNQQAMLPYAEMLYREGRLTQAKGLIERYHKLTSEPTAESLWLALRVERKLGDRIAETSYATQLRRRHANSSEYKSLLRGDYE